MKTKKQLTTKQQYNKQKRLSLGFFFSEFLSIATPFITIAIVNYDKYFVEYSGTKMSISFVMALAVMGLAIFLVGKKKLENSMITLLIGWAVFAFIFTMMGEMITDLSTIMWFGLIGMCGAYGLDIASKNADKKAERIKIAIEKAQDDNITEQAKQENNENVNAGDILG